MGVKKINNSVNYDDIPSDLNVEILFKLPVKSLIRLKSVCKAWKSLINSQVFINAHLHAKNPRFGGFSIRGPKIGDSICPFEIRYIVGTCNGIICLATCSYEKPLVLFNPSTREYSYVPPQLCVPAYCGFWYLPKTQEYQIVLFHELYEYGKLVDITTITLGKIPSSREAKNVSLPGMITTDPVTSGTTMFWLGSEHSDDNQIVIFYDAIEEKFGTMNVPPSPSPPPSNIVSRSLGLLKGSVIMFQHLQCNSTFFDIWMLISDDVSNGKGWTKYRRVGPLCNISGMQRSVYPLQVGWDDRWILCGNNVCWVGLYKSSNMFFYDLETGQVEDYCKIQKDKEEDYKATHPPIYEFVNYQETFVSIDSLVPYIDHEHPEDIR